MAEIRCPYHHASWRCRTQHILNCLRGRLLTRMLAKTFSSYVCVCPGRPSVTSREMLDAAPDLAAWLQGKPSSLPEEVRRSLELYLTAAEELKPAELGLGLVHLVSVIRRAVEGKLEDENSAPSQIKPQYKEDTWTLSLPSRYIGLLIGRGGQHIQTLCREHKAGIYFGKKQLLHHRNTHRLRHYQATYRDSVQVTVVTRENELVNIEAIKSTLETRADELKAKRKAHEEAVEKYRQRRYRRYLHAVHDPGKHITTGVHRDSKEAATDHYYRRKQHQKTRHPPRSHPHSAISEGHCLNCLTAYSPNTTEMGACTFHPGFLTAVKAGKNRGYKWTCCGRRTAEHRATVNQHIRTGCSSGRHRWRPGKSCARKTRDSWLSDDIILI